jgi:anti-sigma factor RsiW
MSHLGRRLSALVDGELGDTERDQAHSHLVSCEECRAEAAALRALKRRVRGLGEAPADSALTRRLIELECLAEAGSLAASRGRLHTRYLVAGAVTALAVGLSAASFAAGDAQQHAPGPTVTPQVDSFNFEHDATFGQSPTLLSPAGVQSQRARSQQTLPQAQLGQAQLRPVQVRQVVGSLKP